MAVTTSHSVSATSTGDFNPFLPEFVENPRPFLRRLRESEPVHWSPIVGVWVISSYEHVLAAQHDERFSASSRHWDRREQFFSRQGMTGGSPAAAVYERWMLQLDPPDHTRLRALVNKAFTPRAVDAMAGRIEMIVAEMLDRVCPSGQMDFVRDLAYPLPIVVISEMLGVPCEDHERIKNWCAAMLPSFSPALSLRSAHDVATAVGEFRDYFRALADQKRRNPGDDLLSALIVARDNSDRLNDDELISTAILLAFAGHASTVQLLAGAIEILISHPDELAKLTANPGLIGSAVEECLRYVSPLQVVYRTTCADVEIAGKRLPKGQMVFLSLMGANFDPKQFADPDRFDITRSPNRHQAFGHGIHYCAGAPLARLEAQIVLPMVMKRLRNLEISGPVTREPSLLLRGITSLPLAFHPG